ncbi:hypothetical protein L1887_14624 [Cichorium endivia]|nr:hypothetical protein L1887_14624 [Cichorium endivia]
MLIVGDGCGKIIPVVIFGRDGIEKCLQLLHVREKCVLGYVFLSLFLLTKSKSQNRSQKAENPSRLRLPASAFSLLPFRRTPPRSSLLRLDQGTPAATTTTSTITTTIAQTSSALVVASSSGTITTVVTPAPKLPSEITGKTVEEIIKEWNVELQERIGKFRKQANAIAEWDRRILQNRDVLLKLEVPDNISMVRNQRSTSESHNNNGNCS